jgi:cysteinyl-tRNA synthetase
MTFQAHNTLSRRKEPLEPTIVPGKVGFYVCGPTVYDLIHIGNARPLVVFDVLFRLLRRTYGEGNVTYVRNITDVDDKINAAAAERGIAIRELTETTAQRFHEDAEALGCLAPTHEPRATDHIPEMIAMIEALIEAGHAYAADGHVLFDVPSYEAYGRLSGNSRDEIVAGARVDVAPYKKDTADFVLTVNGEKMSKSLGNFFTVRELLDEYPGEALRLLLLGTHYRQALDFTRERLAEAKQTLDRFYNALSKAREPQAGELPAEIVAALEDDLNTPLAISHMHALADAVFRGEAGAAASLRAAGAIMGLLGATGQDWFRGGAADDEAAEIEGLIEERLTARKNRDFARADQIRDDLKARGIELMDGPEGTAWRRV